MNLRLFVFGVLIFPLAAFAGATVKTASAPKRLVVLGDSLTEGYGVAREAAFPALLEKKIKDAGKDWVVVNAGVSGSTTASADSRLKWIFKKSKPDLLILCLGANDGLRGLKVPESRKNLKAAIEFAKREKVPLVFGGIYMPPNYGAKYTKEFREMYAGLAKAEKVDFIPFLLEGVAGKPEYNLADGMHPNEKGHAIIADHVFTAIQNKL